jgi:NAD-dependent deacetylase
MKLADIEHARGWLRGSARVAVLTGAGASADSGVPTFRDAQTGLWARHDPMSLASPEGVRRDPGLVWRWYAWRRALVAAAQPNAAHLALARAEAARSPGGLTLVTQNVDGLHQRAGSRAVIELHGNLMRTACLERCGAVFDDPAAVPAGEPPRCPRCGSWLRPDVVWFGEMLDPDRLEAARVAAERCDVMLVIGTAGLVYPAAGLPAAATRSGARVVIVNPQPTELDEGASLVLRGSAAAVVPQLFDQGREP